MGRPDSEAPASSVAATAGRGFQDHGRGGGSPAGGYSPLDPHVLIVLAALLFGLLFVSGLISLARCAFQYCRGRGGSAAASLDGDAPARRGSSGIKRRVLRSLPVEVYGSGEVIDDVCAICLGDFEDGEKMRVLPRCGHGFHVWCVDAWLVSHGSCPTCRCPVIEGAVAKRGGGRSQRPAAAETDMIAVVIV